MSWMTEDGYRRMRVHGRLIFEHRYIMEYMLGRKLLPTENVHHRDGNKQNNAAANLELWARQQPVGQRVTDLLDNAVVVINTYLPLAPKLFHDRSRRRVDAAVVRYLTGETKIGPFDPNQLTLW